MKSCTDIQIFSMGPHPRRLTMAAVCLTLLTLQVARAIQYVSEEDLARLEAEIAGTEAVLEKLGEEREGYAQERDALKEKRDDLYDRAWQFYRRGMRKKWGVGYDEALRNWERATEEQRGAFIERYSKRGRTQKEWLHMNKKLELLEKKIGSIEKKADLISRQLDVLYQQAGIERVSPEDKHEIPFIDLTLDFR